MRVLHISDMHTRYANPTCLLEIHIRYADPILKTKESVSCFRHNVGQRRNDTHVQEKVRLVVCNDEQQQVATKPELDVGQGKTQDDPV